MPNATKWPFWYVICHIASTIPIRLPERAICRTGCGDNLPWIGRKKKDPGKPGSQVREELRSRGICRFKGRIRPAKVKVRDRAGRLAAPRLVRSPSRRDRRRRSGGRRNRWTGRGGGSWYWTLLSPSVGAQARGLFCWDQSRHTRCQPQSVCLHGSIGRIALQQIEAVPLS